MLHTAIENAFGLVEDADYFPEEKNGVRPDDDDDWGVLYTSDLVKPFQDALSDVVPKIKEGTAVKVDMFPRFLPIHVSGVSKNIWTVYILV